MHRSLVLRGAASHRTGVAVSSASPRRPSSRPLPSRSRSRSLALALTLPRPSTRLPTLPLSGLRVLVCVRARACGCARMYAGLSEGDAHWGALGGDAHRRRAVDDEHLIRPSQGSLSAAPATATRPDLRPPVAAANSQRPASDLDGSGTLAGRPAAPTQPATGRAGRDSPGASESSALPSGCK